MAIKIALAGNPNCGKTTMFNDLTGASQYVGNWPGVTVEKKEGRLKGNADIVIQDLPGIYSLSPYTLEEVVARGYLVTEKPDAILNIVDATNIERNLYLTTQLAELGIPMIIALNMIDIVRRNGDRIDLRRLGDALHCEVVETSALKGEGSKAVAEKAAALARTHKTVDQPHVFTGSVEHALAHIEDLTTGRVAPRFLRWYAIKLFERDEKVMDELNLPADTLAAIDEVVTGCEREMDDDAESIITGQRYAYISKLVSACVRRGKPAGSLTISDRIDRVVTNRFAALPIFAAIMFLVYFLSITTVGGWATDWVNDNLFGDGWHLSGQAAEQYEEASAAWDDAMTVIDAFMAAAPEGTLPENADDDPAAAQAALKAWLATLPADFTTDHEVTTDEDTLETEVQTFALAQAKDALAAAEKYAGEAPSPEQFGTWIPGIPVLVAQGLDAVGCADWLKGLILDGIVAGVGAVLGFVPQMIVLFLCLALLEECGYMARIAFIMDRIFRRFGLSGKSFIPMLIGTGCGVPAIMASRTIENERDRRMTIMTTTFIPCSAKLPIIAVVAGAVFGGSAWVAASAYFLGIAAIVVSGIMLKKTRIFAGDAAPFVMELPAYHLPTAGSVVRSVWERASSFVKKAGTVILLSTIVVWFLGFFGVVDGRLAMLEEDQMGQSLLAALGSCLAWIFIPNGFGTWQGAAASLSGLVAKENLVGTMSILYAGEGSFFQQFAGAFPSAVAAYAYLVFNLLDAPCFAALGAIKREMNSAKWFWIAVGYQCGFAWAVSMVVNQLVGLLVGQTVFGVWTILAAAVLGAMIYLLVRPARKASGESSFPI